MIIGIGPGRCGTVSLSKWLNLPHEPKQSRTEYPDNWEQLAKKHPEGWVSFASLRWIDQIDADFILLLRDRDDNVKSLYNHPTKDWFMKVFDFSLNTLEGCYEYYDWYIEEALKHDPIVIAPEQIPVVYNSGTIRVEGT